MGFPSTRTLSWVLAVLLHGDVIVLLAIVFASEEVVVRRPEHPDIHTAIVKPRDPVVVDLPPGSGSGRWPMKCDHRHQSVSIGEDRLGDGLRCEKCGWLWWVIRAASSD